MARGAGVSLCCMLLVVAALAAGASAQAETSCFTSSNPGASFEDANYAFSLFQLSRSTMDCQNKCDGDKCTVLEEYESAQLKMCGECKLCVPRVDLISLFWTVMQKCVKQTSDGRFLVAGEARDDSLGVAIDGKDEEVDAGIKMKVSE